MRSTLRLVRAASALGLLALLAIAARARADAPRARPRRVAILAAGGPDGRAGARARRFVARTRDWARAAGQTPVDDLEGWTIAHGAADGSVRPSRVHALSEVQSLLVDARRQAAALHEGDALRTLARAATIAEDRADVPGSAAWLGEVQTELGIVAAQAGLEALSASALARAATMDPSRGVRAAEAAPDVVAQAAAIARAVATGPISSLTVTCEAPGAHVFLDDVDMGPVPARIHGPVGEHVLRVEAPGCLAWGSAVLLLEGERPSVSVALAPTVEMVADRQIEEAARRVMPTDVVTALARGDAPVDAVWLVVPARGPADRALLVACTRAGCAPPRHLEADDAGGRIGFGPPLEAPAFARALAAGRAWLEARAQTAPPPPPPTPLWQRWWVWAAAGVVAAAATGAAIVAAQPAPMQRPRFVVDANAVFGAQ